MKTRKGFGLVEIIIASSIVSVALISLVSVFVLSYRLTVRSGEIVRANFIAEEGIEAMHFLRDNGWTPTLKNLTSGTNYYLSLNTTTGVWSIGTTNPGLLDNTFKRVITVQSVMRNGSDNIVSSGGTVDINTLKITATVTWGSGNSIAVDTYLSNIYND